MSVTSQDARASGPEAGSSARRWPALLVVLLAAFMDLVDNTIVTVGLPEIRRDLRATDADLQWVAAGYALAFALMLLTGGRLGDVFGRKKTFLAGIVGFTIASALAGAAQGPETLIGARVLQGALAAVMIPQVLTYIQVGFSTAERPRALGLYGMVLALAGVSGPLLGGLLIDADLFGWDWRTIFLINLPIGAAAFLGTAALMPESRAGHTRRLDLGGVVLITLALVAVFYPLVQGRELGWPAWTFLSMAAALPLLLLFVAYERGRTRRDDSPLVDLGLFRERGVVPGLVVALVFFTGGSFFFVLTLHLQIALGYTPLRAGLTFLPFAFGAIIGSGAATRLAPRAGRLVVAVGSVVMGGAVAGMIYTLHRNGAGLSPWHLLPAMVVAGIGLACVSATIVNIALARVSARHAGSASGVVNTTVQLGSAAGIAVIGTVFFSLLAGNAGETAGAETVGAVQAATVAVFLRSSEQALWVIVGLLGVSFLASFLLPPGPVKAVQAGQADETGPQAA